MKTIKFIKDCSFNGKMYFAGDELIEFKNFEEVWKLNEKGFIEPLTVKEFIELQKEVKSKKYKTKEED